MCSLAPSPSSLVPSPSSLVPSPSSLAPSPSSLAPSPSSLVPSPSSLIPSSSSLAPHPPLLYHSCRVIYGVIEFSIYMWAYQRFHLVDLPWDSAWTWWLCFLAYDMGYYFFHRYAHGRPIPAVKVRVCVLLCFALSFSVRPMQRSTCFGPPTKCTTAPRSTTSARH